MSPSPPRALMLAERRRAQALFAQRYPVAQEAIAEAHFITDVFLTTKSIPDPLLHSFRSHLQRTIATLQELETCLETLASLEEEPRL